MADNDQMVKRDSALPEAVSRRGVNEAQWRTLCNSLFPGANPQSVLLVIDYCQSRKLDPMKKPCHIVPMRMKVSGEWVWRDVVMPGVYEFRITASRTREYLGHTKATYGPEIEYLGVKAPEWCEMVIFRNVDGQKAEFPVTCYFKEVVALTTEYGEGTQRSKRVNDRWTRAPIQMLTKCTEAAGLREAFPEELGGEHTEEEMGGKVIDVSPTVQPQSREQTSFETLPEGLRDNIERGFAELNLPGGQRTTLLAEYLGGENVVPEEGAQKLLLHLKDEWARRKTGQPLKRGDDGKGQPKAEKQVVEAELVSEAGAPPANAAPLTAAEVFGKSAAKDSLGF